jgi:predicted Zn-dependent protease
LREAKWVFQSVAGSEADGIQAEYNMGRQLAQFYAEEKGLDPDPQAAELMTFLGRRLAPCVRNQHWRFSFQVVTSPEVNAFAFPGGFVVVTQALLGFCRWDPHELAFILGHEMGHIVHRHALDRMMANHLIGVALRRLPLAGPLSRQVLGGWTHELLHQSYSQDQELEADRFGARLARSAGFDATAALRLLERLQPLAPETGLLGPYFASHPPGSLRVERLRRVIAHGSNR